MEFLCRPVRLSCGQLHTAVVSSSGDVYTWGKSQKGRSVNFCFRFPIYMQSHTMFNSSSFLELVYENVIRYFANCVRKSLAKCIYPKF